MSSARYTYSISPAAVIVAGAILMVLSCLSAVWCDEPLRQDPIRRAVSLMSQGDEREAVRLLETAVEEPGSSADAHLLLGTLFAGREAIVSGRRHLRLAAETHPLLRAYALYTWARLEGRAGDKTEAVRLWDAASKGEIADAMARDALARRGSLLESLGRTREAIEDWEELLALCPADSLEKLALDHLITLNLAVEEWKEAQRWLAYLARLDPPSPEADRARIRSEELSEAGLAPQPVEEPTEYFRQGSILARAGQWEAARKLLSRAADSGEGETLRRAWSKLGDVELGTGLPARAEMYYRRALLEEAAIEIRRAATLGLMRAALAQESTSAAISLWNELGEMDPGGEEFRIGCMWLVDYWREREEWDRATECCREWQSRAGRSAGWEEIAWARAWVLMAAGDTDATLDVMENLVGSESAGYAAAGLYWVNRLLLKHDERERAGACARELQDLFPLSYYGYRIRATQDYPASWPREVGREPEGDRSERFEPHLPGRLPSATGERTENLLRLGMASYALAELESVVDEGDLPHDIYPLYLRLLLNEGRWSDALETARRVFGNDLSAGKDGLPPVVWRAAFPRAYWTEVLTAAETAGIDPHLLWALAREESGFDPRARSRAGALGLVQLMPITARELGGANEAVGGEEDLMRPKENLRLGALYLSSLLERWSGNLPLALAAYNAGPTRARRWARWGSGLEPEELVDRIPYRETRLFVKRVLLSYWEYRRLAYGEEIPPPLLPAIGR